MRAGLDSRVFKSLIWYNVLEMAIVLLYKVAKNVEPFGINWFL